MNGVGGCIGTNGGGKVFNSYSTGAVTSSGGGSTDMGGFAGENISSGIITSCFYDKQSSGRTDDKPGVTSETTAQMQSLTTFNSVWNIANPPTTANVWGIDSTQAINNGYPYLQWAGADTMTPQ